MYSSFQSKFLGSIFGLSIGDALGVPFEFKNRCYIDKKKISCMSGYGTHNQPPGTWSDDTSLSFCLIEALIDGYELNNISNYFLKWWNYNYWTANDEIFDYGRTTYLAINNLNNGVNPLESGIDLEESNGNGALMRIFPLVLYLRNKSINEIFNITKEVSSITHSHSRSIISCFIHVIFGVNLISNHNKIIAWNKTKNDVSNYLNETQYWKNEYHHFTFLFSKDFRNARENSIKSSGYVIDTLESAIWCFLNNSNYSNAVLNAIKLGGDTDTIGSITGSLSGLYYGYDSIPKEWLYKLKKRNKIFELADKFYLSCL